MQRKNGTTKLNCIKAEDINHFSVGHKTLVAESIKELDNAVSLRDVAGIDDSNPYDFEK